VLPEKQDEGEAIGTLWARWKIEDLSDQKVVRGDPGLVRQITDLALAHHLVSAYTSFVAVDEWRRTDLIEPERVENPVPLPQGMTGGVAGSVIGGVVGGVVGSVPVPQDENAEALAERIQVRAQSDIALTESTQTSTTIGSEFISGLPVLGTDYQHILTLAPGVTDPTSGAPNVHGARDTDVVTLVDGVVVEEEDSGAGAIEDLDTEAIEEIEVPTAGAGAAFSRAQGGFVNIVPATGPTRNARGDAGAFPVFCMLKASAKSHRVGEPISLYIGIRNLSGKPLKIPRSLSSLGSVPFRLLDPSWTELPSPVPAPASERRRILLPGEWVFFKVTLNGQGGYKLDRPGIYQVVFLGSKLGLVDSTQLALRIVP
jgi:hypothetical protein